MTVVFSTGERATLPPDYLDAGYLAHAYVSTVHKAQGSTCDRAFLLATDDLYQEPGYVALSRGRLGNHIVTGRRTRALTPKSAARTNHRARQPRRAPIRAIHQPGAATGNRPRPGRPLLIDADG